MERICVFKKTVIFAAACLAVLATLAGCSDGGKKPTPEQVAEREQEKALKGGETMIEKFLHNGKYVKIYEKNAGYSYISVASISSIHITENSVVIHNGFSGSSSLKYDINEYRISIDKERNLIVKPETRQKNKKELEAARKKEQMEERTELLFSAVKSNNLEQAKVCIELGADVNAKSKIKDANGETVLMIAAGEGYKDMAELLIKSGADVNAQDDFGKTALIYAIDKKQIELSEILINSGADINIKDKYGNTALICAVASGNRDFVELLINLGSDMNNVLLLAAEWCYMDWYESKAWGRDNNYKDFVELLIKSGADSGAALRGTMIGHGYRPAHGGYGYIPGERAYYMVAEILVKAGADVNAKDDEGISVLTHAILYGKKDIEKLLRDAGAKE